MNVPTQPKGWRLLRIEEETYSWRITDVSRRDPHGHLRVTVREAAEDLRARGQPLIADTGLAGHYSCPCGTLTRGAITPADIAQLVRRAQRSGWPQATTQPLRTHL